MDVLDRTGCVELGPESWTAEGGPLVYADRALFEPPPSSRMRMATRREHPACSPGEFLMNLLAEIEQREGAHSIAFDAPSGRRIGEVLTIDGQIGLVALSEGQIPLGARLRARNPHVALDVQRALLKAKVEGRALGEVLLEIGSVGAAEIRAALLDQIADGLKEIAGAAALGLVELTAPLSTRRATSILSAFAPAEIYWRVIGRLGSPAEDAAAVCFREVASMNGTGTGTGTAVLATRKADDDGWVPLDAVGLTALSVSDVGQLGRGLMQLAQPPALAAAGVAPKLTMLRSGAESMVCVVTGQQVAVFGGLDGASGLRVLSQACRVLAQLDAEV